jgi:hypothetical protein
MATTTNFSWNYGTENQDPWWTIWTGLFTAIDAEVKYRTQDLYIQGHTIYGNNTSGGNLNLSSTSHAVKGTINLNSGTLISSHSAVGSGATIDQSVQDGPSAGLATTTILNTRESILTNPATIFTIGTTSILNFTPSANIAYPADPYRALFGAWNSLILEPSNKDLTNTVMAGAANELIYSGTGTIYTATGLINFCYNLSSGTIQYGQGAKNSFSNSSTGIINYCYGSQDAIVQNSNGSIGTAYATHSAITNYSTGAITTAYCSYRDFWNYGAGDITNCFGSYTRIRNRLAGGHIGTAYGLAIKDWSNAGTIDTSYGIYLDNSIGVGTAKWAIYSLSTASSSFAGPLLLPDGSAAAPSLARSGGATTGIFFASDPRIDFTFGGTGYNQFAPGFTRLGPNQQLDWNGDTVLIRDGAANILAQKNANNDQTQRWYGANGAYFQVKTVSELLTIAAAANTPTVMQVPLYATVQAVAVYVVTAIPTAATFTVTLTTQGTTLNNAAIGVAQGSSDFGNNNCPVRSTSLQTITITPNAPPAAATGQVRIVLMYTIPSPSTT